MSGCWCIFEMLRERAVANKVWVSDITFIGTREGWLYLTAILDVFNRKIIGWSMDNRLSHEVLADALHKAIRQRRPEAGVMVHSDRGTQYTSYAFQELMEKHGFIRSMNSSGNCYEHKACPWGTMSLWSRFPIL